MLLSGTGSVANDVVRGGRDKVDRVIGRDDTLYYI